MLLHLWQSYFGPIVQLVEPLTNWVDHGHSWASGLLFVLVTALTVTPVALPAAALALIAWACERYAERQAVRRRLAILAPTPLA